MSHLHWHAHLSDLLHLRRTPVQVSKSHTVPGVQVLRAHWAECFAIEAG